MADPSRLLFGIRGRAGRARYVGLSMAMLLLFGLFDDALHRPLSGEAGAYLLGVSIATLAGSWLLLAQTVQRLHDVGLSGWNAVWIELLLAAPLAGLDSAHGRSRLLLAGLAAAYVGFKLWLAIEPGERRRNRWGAPSVRPRPA